MKEAHRTHKYEGTPHFPLSLYVQEGNFTNWRRSDIFLQQEQHGIDGGFQRHREGRRRILRAKLETVQVLPKNVDSRHISNAPRNNKREDFQRQRNP